MALLAEPQFFEKGFKKAKHPEHSVALLLFLFTLDAGLASDAPDTDCWAQALAAVFLPLSNVVNKKDEKATVNLVVCFQICSHRHNPQCFFTLILLQGKVDENVTLISPS